MQSVNGFRVKDKNAPESEGKTTPTKKREGAQNKARTASSNGRVVSSGSVKGDDGDGRDTAR